MALRITHIRKDGDTENEYTAITHLRWVQDGTNAIGIYTRQEMYDFIKYENGKAYVWDTNNNIASLMTAETSRGTRYVKTVADNTKTDNLLSLPRF